MDVRSNARMHTVKPNDMFHIIIMDFYSTELTAAGPD